MDKRKTSNRTEWLSLNANLCTAEQVAIRFKVSEEVVRRWLKVAREATGDVTLKFLPKGQGKFTAKLDPCMRVFL